MENRERDEVIGNLRAQGYSLREVGKALGISGERVRQLIAGRNAKQKNAQKKAQYHFRGVTRPCEACGKPTNNKHHEDYDKPLDVTFICTQCHNLGHSLLRSA